MRKLLLSATVLAAAVAGPAMAGPVNTPITTNPGFLIALSNAKAVFAYKEASDESQLLTLSFGGAIFNNKTDNVGKTQSLGNTAGYIEFELKNLTSLYSFFNDKADTGAGGDGYFHAIYGTKASDFNVTFSATVNNAIAGLFNPILIGFEDRRKGDYDYNDLIFAFEGVRRATIEVPEPASIALLGLGLLGVGMLRRGRPA